MKIFGRFFAIFFFVWTVDASAFNSTDRFEAYLAKNVRRRQQWGALSFKPDMALQSFKRFIAVHHSAGTAESSDATVQSIQRFHVQTRGWSDIAYHFLVGQDGQVYEGRPLAFVGAHVYGHNADSIGVNFLGCYDSKECKPPQYPPVANVTDSMISAMGHLIGVLSQKYAIEINENNIKGHREFSATQTSCPGDRILARMNEIRSIATKISEDSSGPREDL